MIDKSKVKKSFSKSASLYDKFALLQNEVAQKLVNTVISYPILPKTVIDLGAGTGNCSLLLKKYYPDSSLHSLDIAKGMSDFLCRKLTKINEKGSVVTGDFENLPYQEKSFDLGVSNLSFQWIEDISKVLNEVCRVMCGGGVFAFTTLGIGTFEELRHSYLNVIETGGTLPTLHQFESQEKVKRGLYSSGFHKCSVQVWPIRKIYPDFFTFLKMLKSIGAQNAMGNKTSKGLDKKGSLLSLSEYYHKKFALPGGIYATYKIIFAMAVKK